MLRKNTEIVKLEYASKIIRLKNANDFCSENLLNKFPLNLIKDLFDYQWKYLTFK